MAARRAPSARTGSSVPAPPSGVAVATVAPRAVAASIAMVICALFGADDHDPIARADAGRGECGGRRGDRAPQLPAAEALGCRSAWTEVQRWGFVVDIRAPAQQGLGVVESHVGKNRAVSMSSPTSTVSALPDQRNPDQSSRARQNNSGSSMEKVCRSEPFGRGCPAARWHSARKPASCGALVLDCLAPDVDPASVPNHQQTCSLP